MNEFMLGIQFMLLVILSINVFINKSMSKILRNVLLVILFVAACMTLYYWLNSLAAVAVDIRTQMGHSVTPK